MATNISYQSMSGIDGVHISAINPRQTAANKCKAITRNFFSIELAASAIVGACSSAATTAWDHSHDEVVNLSENIPKEMAIGMCTGILSYLACYIIKERCPSKCCSSNSNPDKCKEVTQETIWAGGKAVIIKVFCKNLPIIMSGIAGAFSDDVNRGKLEPLSIEAREMGVGFAIGVGGAILKGILIKSFNYCYKV